MRPDCADLDGANSSAVQSNVQQRFAGGLWDAWLYSSQPRYRVNAALDLVRNARVHFVASDVTYS